MKKFLSFVLCVALCFSLAACTTGVNSLDSTSSDNESNITNSAISEETSSSENDKKDPSAESSKNNTANTQSKTDQSNSAHTHTFSSATCTSPQKCSCGATNGKALGHNYANATCTSPQKCTRCGKTEGSIKHTWKAATCSAPKTCTACGKTEGSKLAHNIDTKTSKCKVCGAFELNVEYATRGAIKESIYWFDEDYPDADWYSIEKIYYRYEDDCQCGRCWFNQLEKGEKPYITIYVVYCYAIDGEESVAVDIMSVHELYDATNDTHYLAVPYIGAYTYSYNTKTYELNEIHGADYNWYYERDDLTLIDKKKVL